MNLTILIILIVKPTAINIIASIILITPLLASIVVHAMCAWKSLKTRH